MKFINKENEQSREFTLNLNYLGFEDELVKELLKLNYENQQSKWVFLFNEEEKKIFDVVQVKVNIKDVGYVIASFDIATFDKKLRKELFDKLLTLKDIDVKDNKDALNNKLSSVFDFLNEYQPYFVLFIINNRLEEIKEILKNKNELSYSLFYSFEELKKEEIISEAETGYKVKVGDKEYPLKETELFGECKEQYVIKGIKVNRNEKIEFYHEGELIYPGDENIEGQERNNNNTKGNYHEGYQIASNNKKADIYLKYYGDNNYSFWVGTSINEKDSKIVRDIKESAKKILKFKFNHIFNAIYFALLALCLLLSEIYFDNKNAGIGILFIAFVILFFGLNVYNVYLFRKENGQQIKLFDHIFLALLSLVGIALGIILGVVMAKNLVKFENPINFKKGITIAVIASIGILIIFHALIYCLRFIIPLLRKIFKRKK